MIRQLALLVLLALAGWFGMGEAKAACTGSLSTGFSCATRSEAYAAISPAHVNRASSCTPTPPPNYTLFDMWGAPSPYTEKAFTWKYACAGGTPTIGSSNSAGKASWTTDCATGTTWSSATNTCATNFDPQACLAHNSEPGFAGVGDTVRSGGSYCVGGCDFRPVAASSSGGIVSVGLPQGGTISRGKWEFTGSACAPADPVKATADVQSENDDPQACVPAGSGQTFCLKKDGQHCASASNGKQICWRPTEVGTKTDANVAQVRNAGTNPPTTPPPAPPGDTLNQQTPITSTTTTTSTGGSSSTNTTTITNYTTASGNDANGGTGGADCGESSSGTGTSACQPGTASGGTDCSTPPIATDPQLAMIATQAWATKCATIAGNSVKVTGDVTNCAAPYTVEGVDGGTSPGAVDANAEKLKALRATICGSYNPDGHDSNAAVNASDDGTSLRDGVISEGTPHGADGLDTAGLGFGRTCPTIPMITVYGHEIDLNRPQLCTWMQIGGEFVLLLAALLSLRIMAGGGAPV